MLRGRFDLHTHTTASDGVFTPAELVHQAYELGLSGLAITDHDTLLGLDEAGDAIAPLNMRLIPGVELSCRAALPGGEPHEAHILGYFVKKPGDELMTRLAELQRFRLGRGKLMLERLAGLGMPLPDLAAAYSGGGSLGRGLIARAMVEAGYARDTGEAFDKWLAPGRPAYEPNRRLEAAEGIGLLHRNGAVAVLAHPVQLADDRLIPLIAAAGVDGLECAHPDHDAALERHYRAMAQSLGLAATGGSDCHAGGLGSHTADAAELDELFFRYRG